MEDLKDQMTCCDNQTNDYEKKYQNKTSLSGTVNAAVDDDDDDTVNTVEAGAMEIYFCGIDGWGDHFSSTR